MESENIISLIIGILVGAWFMWLGIEIYEFSTAKQECKKIDNVMICREVYTHVTTKPYIGENSFIKEVRW